MKTLNEIRNITATQEYDKHFWNATRIKPDSEMAMRDAMDSVTGTYFTPTAGEADLQALEAYTADLIRRWREKQPLMQEKDESAVEQYHYPQLAQKLDGWIQELEREDA